MQPTQKSPQIAIIGPSHPYKGGITMQTTELAHQLQASGASVTVFAWRAQYPKLLYPGTQYGPGDTPERPLFAGTRQDLAWYNPFGWWKLGRALRGYDKVILVWWVPTIQGPVYLTILKALGRAPVEKVLLCHNLLPHEGKPGDRSITRQLLKRIDRVLVHTPAQAQLAASLTTRPVVVAELPTALPSTVPAQPRYIRPLSHQLLFFGLVRPYKGLDVLLRALAGTPAISLLIAGEFWDSDVSYRQLIMELGLGDRVTIHPGYATDEQLADYFAASDALVLPYRGGTASQNVAIAHAFGVPVIATTAGSMGKQVRPNIDGLLCAPDDSADLARAITHFYEPGVAAHLQTGIPAVSTDHGWQVYLSSLLGTSQ